MIEIFLGLSLILSSILIHQVLVLRSRISDLKSKPESDPPGYSKFLEDSREAAFGYIEQVQVAILDLKVQTNSKNKTAAKQAYDKLISLLPEDK